MSDDLGLIREPDDGRLRQEYGTVRETELRLDPADAERLVDALNVDLAGSFNLFYLLRKHYWTAEGAESEEVADFLEDAYQDVRDLNDDIAERIVELGGVPANTPPTLQEAATVHLEAEDLYDMRAALEGDLEAYATLVASMRDHAALAADLGDPGTETFLREELEDLEEDAHTVERFLEDDTLVCF